MRIDTFIKLFDSKKDDADKIDAVKQIMKNETIKYTDKVDRANLIAKHSYYTKEKDVNRVEQDVFRQNSAAKYMLYSLSLVDMYTTLEVDFKKSVDCFEKINGEILDLIISLIDERERKEFKMLLDFACDDIMTNEYEPHAFLRNQVNRFGELIGASLAPVLESVDMNKLEEIVKQMK